MCGSKAAWWCNLVVSELQPEIEAIAHNAALYEETNFSSRAAALDHIEFHIMDRIEALLGTANPPAALVSLKQSAAQVTHQLAAVDDALFRRLRSEIRRGEYTGTALTGLIEAYVGRAADRPRDEIGYDHLDEFVHGLLLMHPVPEVSQRGEPEMVAYQPTPARIILELNERARCTEPDVFYDVGSGLGQVPILMHLLSGVAARGIEFEPAYCRYARACAAALGLSGVAFIHADARAAAYGAGTVFYLYTPFVGSILQAVLDRLWSAAQQRTIRLFTYGPCTPAVAGQSWLKGEDRNGAAVDKLAEFRSR